MKTIKTFESYSRNKVYYVTMGYFNDNNSKSDPMYIIAEDEDQAELIGSSYSGDFVKSIKIIDPVGKANMSELVDSGMVGKIYHLGATIPPYAIDKNDPKVYSRLNVWVFDDMCDM